VGDGKETFTGTFSKEQTEGSSTVREIRGYAAAIVIPAQQFPTKLHGTSILIEGDNQCAISALNHLRSPVTEINDLLKGVFKLCSEFRADVIGRWIPRGMLEEADALSREPDAGDWGISQHVYQDACQVLHVSPKIDVFGSDVHHVTARFISQFYTPGCMAIDAIRVDWSAIVPKDEVAWVFPPNRYTSVAISMIERYHVNALISLPIRAGSNELIQLDRLEGAMVSLPVKVPRNAESCIKISRVPDKTLNPAFLELGIFRIKWN
jgi:hypothetical protein